MSAKKGPTNMKKLKFANLENSDIEKENALMVLRLSRTVLFSVARRNKSLCIYLAGFDIAAVANAMMDRFHLLFPVTGPARQRNETKADFCAPLDLHLARRRCKKGQTGTITEALQKMFLIPKSDHSAARFGLL